MGIITFTKYELTPKGTRLIISLHIDIECKGVIITRVLIDNGSTLNVYSLEKLERLGVKYSMIRLDGRMSRAFGGGQTVALGEIYLKALIGPYEFEASFIVIDIPSVYNFS